MTIVVAVAVVRGRSPGAPPEVDGGPNPSPLEKRLEPRAVTAPSMSRALVVVTPDDRKLYVCDSLSNTVTAVVGDGPWGVTIRRAG